MHGMAFAAAGIDCRMDMSCLSMTLKGVFMTAPTHLALLALQQTGAVAGMGTVTICTAVAGVGA